jgi:hypothetical protein
MAFPSSGRLAAHRRSKHGGPAPIPRSAGPRLPAVLVAPPLVDPSLGVALGVGAPSAESAEAAAAAAPSSVNAEVAALQALLS